MEKTLIILKPDCMAKGLAGKVLERFERAGYQVVGSKMVQLTSQMLDEHYAHLVGLPFYPSLVEFMQSRPVMVLVLEGENVISGVRALLGPTNSAKAPKGTIRGDFGGPDIMHNVVHASDSEVNAEKEMERFFSAEEIFALEECLA